MNKFITEYLWLTSKYDQCQPFFLNMIKDAGSIEALYDRTSFKDMPYLGYRDVRLLNDKSVSKAERILEDCAKNNIDVVTYFDENYPAKLREIANPPLVLYCKGKVADFDNDLTISVVGSRKPVESSRRVTEEIVKGLVCSGVTIVSGLAYGIDYIAHTTALENRGKTTAFLAGGLDNIYPSQHYGLAEYIMSNGGLISEYPPGMRSLPQNFHLRNRLISAVSEGVLVVQAGEKSGTQITANHACDQNKDLFVVPGDVYIFQFSNNLIKQGAKPVTNAIDILEEYISVYPDKIVRDKPKDENVQDKAPKNSTFKTNDETPVKEKTQEHTHAEHKADSNLTENERKLLTALRKNPGSSVDDLVELTGETVAVCSSVLTILEMKGVVVKIGGVYRIK